MSQLKLVFLGTGAAVPSPRRGLPSLALVREGEAILCDCAEGTQMCFSPSGLSPSKIRHLFLSHLHGDHIFGVPGFLTTQQMMSRVSPLTIIGPVGVNYFLDCIRRVSGFRIDYPLQIAELSADSRRFFQAGAFHVTAMPLQHSTLCFGFRFEEEPKPGKFDAEVAAKLGIPFGPLRSELMRGQTIELSDGRRISPEQVVGPARRGRSIGYCTDTRPCPAAIELAQNCDVLVHDSTFSEANRDQAEKSLHSTAIEAAEIANQAHVKKLVLWHISGRNSEEQEAKMLKEARSVFPDSYLPQDFASMEIENADENEAHAGTDQ